MRFFIVFRNYPAFILILILFTICKLSLAQSQTIGSCKTDIINTQAGPVCGTTIQTSTEKIAEAFLGIPYGQSTAGENRFKAPLPAKSWQETLVADQFGLNCPEVIGKDDTQSEDCLSINVWIPEGAKSGDDLPVMAFIYGGAFVIGNAANPLYDGSYIAANEDIIVVSFNYRIGAFGFLVTEELDGNYGFQDQQLALKWINENIQSFGGDPEKVTIFGESAGAVSVSIHLASAPDSEDLFRAGIMESNPFGLPLKTTEDAKNVGRLFQMMMDCKDADCLRDQTVRELINAQIFMEKIKDSVFSGWQYNLTWNPVVDGSLITKNAILAIEEGKLKKPVIIGTNSGEGELFEGLTRLSLGRATDKTFSFRGYVSWLASVFGDDFEQVETIYPANELKDNEPVIATVYTDFAFSCANRHIGQFGSDSGAPVYLYFFSHDSSFNFLCLPECVRDTCHEAELPFVFHTVEKLSPCPLSGPKGKLGFKFTEDEEQLSQTMINYWTNFARDMDPNGSGSKKAQFKWSPFTRNDPSYMIFDSFPVRSETDPLESICDFWDGIGYFLKTPWIP